MTTKVNFVRTEKRVWLLVGKTGERQEVLAAFDRNPLKIGKFYEPGWEELFVEECAIQTIESSSLN